LETDEIIVEAVLRNLITNAFKFSPESGKLGFQLVVLEDSVAISIRDFGPGFPPGLESSLHAERPLFTTKGSLGELGSGFGLRQVMT